MILYKEELDPMLDYSQEPLCCGFSYQFKGNTKIGLGYFKVRPQT